MTTSNPLPQSKTTSEQSFESHQSNFIGDLWNNVMLTLLAPNVVFFTPS